MVFISLLTSIKQLGRNKTIEKNIEGPTLAFNEFSLHLSLDWLHPRADWLHPYAYEANPQANEASSFAK